MICLPRSLSARRAWIEISGQQEEKQESENVALRKESVDRNVDYIIDYVNDASRSPQGERG